MKNLDSFKNVVACTYQGTSDSGHEFTISMLMDQHSEELVDEPFPLWWVYRPF